MEKFGLAEEKAPLLPPIDLLEALDSPDEKVQEEATQQLRQLLEKQAEQPLDDITFERERSCLLKERGTPQ